MKNRRNEQKKNDRPKSNIPIMILNVHDLNISIESERYCRGR